MVDSHTHLDLCEPSDDELVAAAHAAGVDRLVTVGTTTASCQAALDAAERHAGVFAAVGRHPNFATGFGERDLAELRVLAGHERCVAIGETGLDFHRDYAPRDSQLRAFHAQIELARELGKPLIIHTRAAAEETLSVLDEQARGVKVILHCFTLTEQLDRCLDHPDWWISFAGNATFPKAPELRAAALRVPGERLLVETDAPYLSPRPLRGRPNQPANVMHTAQALALERRTPWSEFEAGVDAAAAAVFSW